jgi:hypothetical protein
MNLTTTTRLLWKEYRAIRAFWLSIVVLAVLLQCLVLAVSESPASMTLLYSIGMAAPALFALGATGAAFSMEREEGTFDFLRTAPITAGQVFTSKLGIATVAAATMFALLAGATVLLTYPRSPEALDGILGLWGVAVLEAIAWGTLFSLLTARPLAAIVMAVAAASTAAHLLAWSAVQPPIEPFELAPYLTAVPRRLLLATAILAIDAYLGLRWLGMAEPVRRGRSAIALRTVQRVVSTDSTDQVVASRLLGRSDRSGILAHLLWQHWRQSAWLMLLMASLHVTLTLLIILRSEWPHYIAVIPLLAFPGLMGCFVFLVDQEQARYRFFVEHNVPPRYVWLTRQLLWLITLISSTTIIMFALLGPRHLFQIWLLVQTATDPWSYWRQPPFTNTGFIDLPHVTRFAVGVAVCYAAGQWASMMVRSGVLAAATGLALAGVACSWAVLMVALQVNWLWSVVPIPLLLMWATWLRAPDWVRENTSFKARACAAAALIVPAFALAVAVPIYRVHELPIVSPGFDVAAYEATITPEARQTAELFRRASDRYEGASISTGFNGNGSRVRVVLSPGDLNAGNDRTPSEAARRWLDKNAEALALVLEASRRPTCVFYDPRTESDPAELRYGMPLVQLVLVSGRLLESEGKLDEAMDRYFTALRVVSQLANNPGTADSRERLLGVKLVFAELVAWGTHKNQSNEGLRRAIKRLQDLDVDLLRVDDRLKNEFIVARRYVLGDPAAWTALFGRLSNDRMPPMRWPTLLPWEEDRGLRELNLLMASNFQRLEQVRRTIALNEGVANWLPSLPWGYLAEYIWNKNEGWNDVRRRPPDFDWVDEITPQLGGVRELGEFVDLVTAELAAQRRGTLLQLALEAFRLDYQKLPKSLDVLAGDHLGAYFTALPQDPYSGRSFLYFPDGLPEPSDGLEQAQLERVWLVQPEHERLTPGIPCIWCSGPLLRAVPYLTQSPETSQKLDDPVYYVLRPPDFRANAHQVPKFIAWARGFWFPIPSATHE